MSNTVYILDDDEAVADSVAELAQSVGLHTQVFTDPQLFLAAQPLPVPGCVVIDVRMPKMSGIDVQTALNELGSPLKLVFITGHGDVTTAVKAMRDGAVDFLLKPVREQELLDSIQRALQSVEYVTLSNQGEDSEQVKKRISTLTEREEQLMRAVVRGDANKVIAADLGISQRTVEIHRSNMMEKMGVRRLADLVRNCLMAGVA